jgi:hypothetical protein
VWARRAGPSGERASPKQFEEMKRLLDEQHGEPPETLPVEPAQRSRSPSDLLRPDGVAEIAAWIVVGFFIIYALLILGAFIFGLIVEGSRTVVGTGAAIHSDHLATASSEGRGASQAPTSVQGPDCRVNLAGFERLTPGMSHATVAGLLGCPGRETARSEHLGFSTAMYAWGGEGERALMSVLFQNDALTQKTQFGLK